MVVFSFFVIIIIIIVIIISSCGAWEPRGTAPKGARAAPGRIRGPPRDQRSAPPQPPPQISLAKEPRGGLNPTPLPPPLGPPGPPNHPLGAVHPVLLHAPPPRHISATQNPPKEGRGRGGLFGDRSPNLGTSQRAKPFQPSPPPSPPPSPRRVQSCMVFNFVGFCFVFIIMTIFQVAIHKVLRVSLRPRGSFQTLVFYFVLYGKYQKKRPLYPFLL